MDRPRHPVFEAVDRVSGARYRLDPSEHPDDLLDVLAASGWYLVRPIRRVADGRPCELRSPLDERESRRSLRLGSRPHDDVA